MGPWGERRAVCAATSAFGLVLVGCGGATRTVTETVASTSAKPATAMAPNVVLGSKSFVSGGEGWGTPHPSRIYNGGDPSGLVSDIHWTDWGQSVAPGTGMHSIFKPGGGYYPQPVMAHLRASDIGTCSPGGPRAYLKLTVQDPTRPGGPLGPPYAWSEARTLCSYGSGASASTETAKSRPPETTSTEETSTKAQPAEKRLHYLAVHDFNNNSLGVKVEEVVDPAEPSTEDVKPASGRRFVAIVLFLANGGPGTIKSDANSNVTVIGTDSQSYTPMFAPVSECTNFSYGEYTLPPALVPGASRGGRTITIRPLPTLEEPELRSRLPCSLGCRRLRPGQARSGAADRPTRKPTGPSA
jgi:hypothetical protein